MKKRILSILLSFLMAFSLSAEVFATTDYRVAYNISKPLTVNVGEEFAISIGYKNMKNHTIDYTMFLYYDDSIYEYVSSANGNVQTCTITDRGNGQLVITFLAYEGNFQYDSITVKELKFKARKTGTGKFELKCTSWSDDINGYTLWDSIKQGIPPGADTSFTINATKNSVSSNTSKTYYGDINGDGKVTASDARSILRHSANLEKIKDSYKYLADINSDKKINAADARTVLRMSAKLENFKTYSSGGSSENVTEKNEHICTMDYNGDCPVCGRDMTKVLEDMTKVLERDKIILEYYNKMIDATIDGKYQSAARYAARVQSEINNACIYAKRQPEMANIYQIYDDLYRDYKAMLDSMRGADGNIIANFSNMYYICKNYDLDAHEKITAEFKVITLRHFGDYITYN